MLHRTICCFLQFLGRLYKLAVMYKAALVVLSRVKDFKAGSVISLHNLFVLSIDIL